MKEFVKVYDKIISEMNPDIMRAVGFGDSVDAVQNGICPCCGCKVNANEFKDELSKKEFGISGLCQKCQDEVFDASTETLNETTDQEEIVESSEEVGESTFKEDNQSLIDLIYDNLELIQDSIIDGEFAKEYPQKFQNKFEKILGDLLPSDLNNKIIRLIAIDVLKNDPDRIYDIIYDNFDSEIKPVIEYL